MSDPDPTAIIAEEQNTLENKKQIANAVLISQGRETELLASSAERTRAYNQIIIAGVIGFAASIFFNVLGKLLPFIPSFIFDILQILSIAIAIIYGFVVYSDIQNRDKLKFDEIVTPQVVVQTDAEKKAAIQAAQKKAQASGDLLGSMNLGTCIGYNCCSGETTWNANLNVCETFTAMSFSQKIGDINMVVQPNSPFEYGNYVRVM
jgi:hypothetical protein